MSARDGEQSQSAVTVKVFISSLCASKEAKLQQQRIVQALEAKNVTFDTKDIATDASAKRNFRMLMRGYFKNDAVVAPPQIFNGDYLCGDYEAFYWAVEEERLLEFLRLAPPSKKTAPLSNTTSAVNKGLIATSDINQPSSGLHSSTCNLLEQDIGKVPSEECAPATTPDFPPPAPLLEPPSQLVPPAPPPLPPPLAVSTTS